MDSDKYAFLVKFVSKQMATIEIDNSHMMASL